MATLRCLTLALTILVSTSSDLQEQDCPTKEDQAPDLIFLQVDTNVTAKERLATHAAALAKLADEINSSELAAAAAVFTGSPASDVPQSLTETKSAASGNGTDHHGHKGEHRKFNIHPSAFSLTSLYRNVQRLHATSGVAASGTMVALGVILVLVMGCFFGLAFMYSSTGSQKPADSQKSIGTSSTLPARSYVPPGSSRPSVQGAVAPPILCRELVLPNTEARFQIDMTDLMDAAASEFNIMSPSGKPLLKAVLTEGRTLSICSAGQSTARVLVRAGTAMGPPLLSILAADGASFGKVSEGPYKKGMVLYHMNKPSVALMVNDISRLDMTAIPLAGPLSGPCATLSRSGSSLRLQVRPGQDAILYLAAFLSVIQLEPKLMEKAVGVSLEEVLRS